MQTTITIKGDISSEIAQAFKAMAQAVNLQYSSSFDKNIEQRLDSKDIAYLKSIIEKIEKGEAKTHTSQEFQKLMQSKGIAW